MGALERPERQLDQELLDSDHNGELRNRSHPRQNAGYPPDDYDLWLDPGFSDVTAVSEMLRPYDARLMRSYPVSTRINQAANDDARVCEAG
jgi:putative SOS response-associated peptidase YedK